MTKEWRGGTDWPPRGYSRPYGPRFASRLTELQDAFIPFVPDHTHTYWQEPALWVTAPVGLGPTERLGVR